MMKTLWIFCLLIIITNPKVGYGDFNKSIPISATLQSDFPISSRFLEDCNKDSDKDGFSDCVESRYKDLGFDPVVSTQDFDRDGLTDPVEAIIGTDNKILDTDGDHYSDFDEYINSSFGFDPLILSIDTDYDGLTDNLEMILGSDLLSIDTDNDHATDFMEYQADTDPVIADVPFEAVISGMIPSSTAFPYKEKLSRSQIEMLYGGEFISDPYEKGTVVPSAALLLVSASFQDDLYHTYDEVSALLIARSEQYDGDPKPDIMTIHIIGQTHEGRDIFAVKISDNPEVNEPLEKEVLFNGSHHAIELVGVEISLTLIDELLSKYEVNDPFVQAIVDNNEIWIIPIMNPDGHIKVEQGLYWRKNTKLFPGQNEINKGVDLNRNYAFRWNDCGTTEIEKTTRCRDGTNPTSGSYIGPGPFSEEETQAIRNLVNNTSMVDGFTSSLSWHSYGGEILYPWHYTEVAPYQNEQDQERFERAAQLLKDAIAQARSTRGEPADGYDIIHPFRYLTGGSSDDWLYAEKGILALSIEAYGEEEGNSDSPNGEFNPSTQATLDKVISNNLNAALAFASDDIDFYSYLPMVGR